MKNGHILLQQIGLANGLGGWAEISFFRLARSTSLCLAQINQNQTFVSTCYALLCLYSLLVNGVALLSDKSKSAIATALIAEASVSRLEREMYVEELRLKDTRGGITALINSLQINN